MFIPANYFLEVCKKMQDAVPMGTGNSRYLKTAASALSQYPTYEDFMTALISGTFPVDFNGINPDGWAQQGTALNKANLLTDATAAMVDLGSEATLNDVLAVLADVTPIKRGGTGSDDGTAPRAEKLKTPSVIIINLSKTENTNFDGSENVTLGVSGVLGVAHGGTDANTAPGALNNLGITWGTSDKTAGSSDLPTGAIYLVYE